MSGEKGITFWEISLMTQFRASMVSFFGDKFDDSVGSVG